MNKIENIIEYLKAQNRTISFAESCTGGRIASAFTAVSGASAILNGSCITYSNEIKQRWLGVREKTLIEYGAVSSECVEEMLVGIKEMASSDYAIAVSGIAGPTGGTEEKPIGTVYIGLLTPKGIDIGLYNFDGSREEIQKEATYMAIEKIYKEIV